MVFEKKIIMCTPYLYMASMNIVCTLYQPTITHTKTLIKHGTIWCAYSIVYVANITPE